MTKFSELIEPGVEFKTLGEGMSWTEGPLWLADRQSCIFSDIHNNAIMAWSEPKQTMSVFANNVEFTNGRAIDGNGDIIECSHGRRAVQRRSASTGEVTVLVDHFAGVSLNSPNDVVVASDGAIWFSDPAYGIDSDYEGNKSESEIGACYVYRVDNDGKIEAVITDMVRPNGLAFSLDETQLYVVDTGRTHGPDNPAHMRLFDISSDNKVSGGRVFADCTAGLFDGFRLDSDGRIWTSAADGVHCYDPDGTLIGKVKVPEVVANVVFGGPKRNILYICGTTSLYAVRLMVNGPKLY